MKTVNTVVNDIFIEHFTFRNEHSFYKRSRRFKMQKKGMSNLTPSESFNGVTVPIFSIGRKQCSFLFCVLFFYFFCL